MKIKAEKIKAWRIQAFSALLLLGITQVGFAAGFSVSSAQIKPNATLTQQQVFNGFGCSGENISPQLAWHGAPVGTQSYALTIYDPDAPTGSGWWHWVVVNIPATATQLEQGAGSADSKLLPAGAQQVRTDFGVAGFGGACPPVGDKPHHYQITVYALKVAKLDIPADATAALAGFMIHANTLGKATMTAYYGR